MARFWNALERSSPKLGSITKLSQPVKKLLEFKNSTVAKNDLATRRGLPRCGASRIRIFDNKHHCFHCFRGSRSRRANRNILLFFPFRRKSKEIAKPLKRNGIRSRSKPFPTRATCHFRSAATAGRCCRTLLLADAQTILKNKPLKQCISHNMTLLTPQDITLNFEGISFYRMSSTLVQIFMTRWERHTTTIGWPRAPDLTHQPPAMPFGNRKKNTLEDLFRSVLSQFKKYRPSGNLKFNYLGIFQSSKLRILMGKILTISLKVNFTINTLGWYGLNFRHVPVQNICGK